MLSKEEILDSVEEGVHHPNYYNAILNAMDEYAKEVAIDFFKWYAIKMMGFLTYLQDIKPQVTSDEIEEKLIEFEGQTFENLFKLYKKENP